MSSVSSVSSNSYSSSIYGNRNVLTGLATGMDTESMIENSISGYKAKLTELEQSKVKTEWKQDAYRAITDELIDFNQNYTSYTSKTNLYSESFFDKSVTTALGDNASKVTASGRSSASVAINSVTTLAKGASYTVSAAELGMAATSGKLMNWSDDGITTADQLNGATINVTLDGVTKKITLGSLYTKSPGMITVGDQNFRTSQLQSSNPEVQSALQNQLSNALKTALTDEINSQLEKNFGTYLKTDAATGKSERVARVSVEYKTGELAFSVQSGSTMSAISQNEALGLTGGVTNYTDIKRSIGDVLGSKWDWGEYDDKEESLVINGVEVGKFRSGDSIEKVLSAISSSDAGVTATYSAMTGEFSFSALDTGSFTKVEFGDGLAKSLFCPDAISPDSDLREVFGNIFGGPLTEDDDPGFTWVMGSSSASYNVHYTENMTVQDLMDELNEKAGWKISYDALSGQFDFGDATIYLQNGTYPAPKLSDFLVGRGGTYQAGTDAELSVNINGRNINLTRSTNAVELEGLTVTLKGTFNEDSVPAEGVGQAASSAVTFSTVADSTELIDTIRTMVNDFNNALKSIHDAISTQPLEKSTSKHTKYEPLTDEDKADMSDSAVEAYEEKAKTGLLFNDSDLNTLYSRLTGIISGGALAQELREIGIEANYSTTTKLYSLSIDEDQLRSALEANTDKVASVFTRIADSENGQAGGLMSQLKTQLDTYTSTSFTDPGILVKKAGTTKSATSLLKNDMLDELTAWDNKIETWQDRINTKIDYYTRMFTTLEKMTAQMNNQSSMFAGLMGY